MAGVRLALGSRRSRRTAGPLIAYAIEGDTDHSTRIGNAAPIRAGKSTAWRSAAAPASASASKPSGSATAGHMVSHAASGPEEMSRSVCEAVCHSSSWRRVTSSRHRVRRIASAETQAWCGRNVMARAVCCMLAAASWATAA